MLATGALLWGLSAAPASADSERDAQWPIKKYDLANKVWPITQGDGVIVAVIDSGVAKHQDLEGQVVPASTTRVQRVTSVPTPTGTVRRWQL